MLIFHQERLRSGAAGGSVVDRVPDHPINRSIDRISDDPIDRLVRKNKQKSKVYSHPASSKLKIIRKLIGCSTAQNINIHDLE
jgi:hypothetical protein